MKICDQHWNKLKQAIKDRGLYDYVAKSGEEVADDLINGKPDPLMSAHNAIVSNALDRAGLEIMIDNADGSERCPICFLKAAASDPNYECKCGDPACTPESRAAMFERWIDRAADDELARFSGMRGKT